MKEIQFLRKDEPNNNPKYFQQDVRFVLILIYLASENKNIKENHSNIDNPHFFHSSVLIYSPKSRLFDCKDKMSPFIFLWINSVTFNKCIRFYSKQIDKFILLYLFCQKNVTHKCKSIYLLNFEIYHENYSITSFVLFLSSERNANIRN